ncbi:MAG: hypothetical protein E4H14_05110 [Candidatus Thorarchaeota archaeon]|nr:MAG: hypothetical protein E4H14_05110 [Candidatus Thorarchaeota archaeon]
MTDVFDNFGDGTPLQIGGFSLTTIIAGALAIGVLVAIVVFWKKIHIPKQESKKLRVTQKFIENGKVKGGVEGYIVQENTALWYMGTIFASHTKKGGEKKPLQPIIEQLVEKEFPQSFDEKGEKTLMGMCQELADHNYFEFLSNLSKELLRKLGEKRFELKLEDNEFRMRSWATSILIVRQPRLRGELNVQLERTAVPIKEMSTKTHLREEFVPYFSQILVNSWDDTTWAKDWISNLFQPFDLEYKTYFLKELHQVSQSYEKISMFDAIVKTIELKTILDRPQEEWEGIIDTLISLGYATRPLNLNTEGITDVPLKQRIDLACIVQARKKKLDDEQVFTSLLFVDQKDYEKFYDLELPEGIVTYYMNELRKTRVPGHLIKAPFIQLNRTGIMNILHSYQKNELTQDAMNEVLKQIPDEVHDKIHGSSETRAIFRYVISTIILNYLKDHKYDNVIAHLKYYRAPFDTVVDAVESSITNTLVTHGNDKSFQQFLLSLQSELLESETDKKSVRKIVDWLKMWSMINETTKGEQNKDAYVSGLLDVVKETKGEFEPRAIANQALTLLTDELDNSVRIYKSGGIVNNLFYQAKKIEVKARLESIKHVYYKLLLLADNKDLALSEEDREFMRKVANEVLSFVIKTRRKDFLERMNHVSVGLAEVIDPGALLNKTFGHSSFATLPETFHTFALPAMLVLNEFLTNPIRIPFVGSKEEGVLINPMFWVFGAAVSLALAPIMAHTESTYSDYFIIEYLKTTTLAVKKAEGPIAKLLVKILPELTSENLLVKALKQLMDFHHLQGIITRDMIIEALEFGGWSIELADKIIEDKDYCIYCSFELPKDAQVCPNCKREVKEIDIASFTSEEIAVDLSQLGMDVGDAGPAPSPVPGPVLRQEDIQPGGAAPPFEEEIVEDKYCIYCSIVLPEDAEICPNCEKPVGEIKEDE